MVDVQLPTSPIATHGRGIVRCGCSGKHHAPRFVAVTGGPGAGKTAVLKVARHRFCEHVHVLPEAATMLFANGFPRYANPASMRAAQRAIFSVQREIETSIASEGTTAVGLCDRGTVDGLAYWPGAIDDFFSAHATTRSEQLARYAAVVHLRTPAARHYNHANTVRIETAEEAQRLDDKIQAAWAGHPNIHFIDSTDDFIVKTTRALEIIERELPACCAHRPSAA
jgi:predicted ATPase